MVSACHRKLDADRSFLLEDYDSNEGGPLFAVSDEGSAGQAVVDAAYWSAKAEVGRAKSAFQLGVILDGERMTSAGETPIGPPEYRALRDTALGRLLLTTNVGTRVNIRFAGQLPEFPAEPDSVEAIVNAFSPFLRTPNEQSRPLTVRIRVERGTSDAKLRELVRNVDEQRAIGRVGPTTLHKLSLAVVFNEPIEAETQLVEIEAAIAAAAELQISEVAIDGEPLPFGRARLSAAGLLNVLQIEHLSRLLGVAKKHNVRLTGRYQTDVEATARTIWAGLETARNQDFDGGKFGLFPLTLEEQQAVIELIMRWTAGWTAVPAFYVDTPLVGGSDVFDIEQCEAAARLWLKAARGAGATVALFDAPDRVAPRRLVKSEESPDGVLTLDQIERLSRYGDLLGIKIMWSGGITAGQALELAKRRVFAIFSTSSTASKIAVTAPFAGDPRMASENEPQEFGVRRMHAIIQAGFLSSRLKASQNKLTQELETAATAMVGAPISSAETKTTLADLNGLLREAWIALDADAAAEATLPRANSTRKPRPVPANSVRVFVGRKHSGADHNAFVRRLETVFMPMTVQMQRLYGLNAYLPAVPQNSDDSAVPDEVALVFYRTQESYHHAKRCIGGRAYSELHELAFDMTSSRSGFPELFDKQIEANHPYHLFEQSVDWQSGTSRLFVGKRKPDISAARFSDGMLAAVKGVQANPGTLDAAIIVANEETILWWDHSPNVSGASTEYFGKVADPVYAADARRLRIPTELTDPFVGLSLNSEGDFLNFQFPRLPPEEGVRFTWRNDHG